MGYYATPIDLPYARVTLAASDFTTAALRAAPRREVMARGVELVGQVGLQVLADYIRSRPASATDAATLSPVDLPFARAR